jgi:hypothetical protein
MARAKVVINWDQVDAAVAEQIESISWRIANECGPHYGYSVKKYAFPGRQNRPRTHGLIFTDDTAGRVDNARHNRILKAAQSWQAADV